MNATATALGRPARAAFTLVEIVVALTVASLLVVMLGRSMTDTLFNQDALSREMDSHRAAIPLRRLLHRDLQGVTDPETVSIGGSSMSFTTTNNLLTDGPLPASVTWKYADGELTRSESIAALSYSQKLVLMQGLTGFSMRGFVPLTGLWQDFSDLSLTQFGAGEIPFRALRVSILREDTPELVITERMPEVLYGQ